MSYSHYDKAAIVNGRCCLLLLLLDVLGSQVDKAIAGGFGMPMGPFRLSDLVGSDIGLHVGKNFVDSFPERVYVSQIFPMLVEAKRLGEKSGAGFYKVRLGYSWCLSVVVRPVLLQQSCCC